MVEIKNLGFYINGFGYVIGPVKVRDMGFGPFIPECCFYYTNGEYSSLYSKSGVAYRKEDKRHNIVREATPSEAKASKGWREIEFYNFVNTHGFPN